MNRFHANLDIPVDYTFPQVVIPDLRFHYHSSLSNPDVCSNLLTWLATLKLYVHHSEFFYTPPGRTLEPHIDGETINNKVKLNWMSGGQGSCMQWFELKPGKNLEKGYTVIGTPYSKMKRSDIVLKHEAAIGTPSLVNVGQIHAIQNRDEPRYVASYLLGDKATKQILQWDQAINIFKDYVV